MVLAEHSKLYDWLNQETQSGRPITLLKEYFSPSAGEQLLQIFGHQILQ